MEAKTNQHYTDGLQCKQKNPIGVHQMVQGFEEVKNGGIPKLKQNGIRTKEDLSDGHPQEPCSVHDLVEDFNEARNAGLGKLDRLREMDVFVLDNSLRESTVAQLRGHTLENKKKIFAEVKKCGFKNCVVAAFGQNTRVDDVWVKYLIDSGEDPSRLWAFSDITKEVKNGVPNTEQVPTGLEKMEDTGLENPILEIDLSEKSFNFERFPLGDMLQLLRKWIQWSHDHLSRTSKVLVNFRDIGEVMQQGGSHRIFKTVDFLAKLPENIRPLGLLYEDVSGNPMPEEVACWAKYIRKWMDANNWNGHLLVHVHEKYGFSDASQLQSLLSGANGVWASVCSEGASLGHASSTVTLMNLVRLGNRKVTKMYNCKYLRKAAHNVTQLTTGGPPHPKHPVYGARALDFVFSMGEVEFDMAEFFGEERPNRMTTLASEQMIVDSLVRTFGEHEQFNEGIAKRMKEMMIEDLSTNRKEEYMSAAGLAVLFDRSGGKMTERMMEVVVEMEMHSAHADNLIKAVRAIWDEWDSREEDRDDEMLTFDSFYNGFMAPYFGCYKCEDTRKGLQAIDMDNDGQVDWNEFLIYLKWAMHENPDMRDADELLNYTFTKGIIPAMRDEVIKREL